MCCRAAGARKMEVAARCRVQVPGQQLSASSRAQPGKVVRPSMAMASWGAAMSSSSSSDIHDFSPKVDTSTGEAEEDGVEDEYQIEDFEITAADYMLKVAVSNFRNAWENMDLDSERVDEYGLGARESLAEAVSAVINILGMQPCEGTEVVPKNARSHTCLLSGVFIGDVKVLVRLSFGLGGPNEVAMKLAVRSDDPEVSDKIHEIVASG